MTDTNHFQNLSFKIFVSELRKVYEEPGCKMIEILINIQSC